MDDNDLSDKMDQLLEASQQLSIAYEEARHADDADAERFWNKLSYEDKCNAFHAVVSRICEAEIEQKSSYRYALYNVFGFGPDMYTRGMDCGYMALHNSIMNEEQFNKANRWMAGEGQEDAS